MILGAGRKDKDSPVDLSAGIVLHKKTGDFVNKNEEIATIYFNKKEVKNDVINIILNSYKIVDKKCEKPELIKQIIKYNYTLNYVEIVVKTCYNKLMK